MNFYEDLLHSKLFWLTAVLSSAYLYLKYKFYNYWSRLGVPHDSPTIPLGNVPLAYFTGHLPHGEIIRASYDKYKNHPFHGLYMLNEPILVINDLDLIRWVLAKNFWNFCNRGSYNNETVDPLSCALPNLVDEKWKRLRSKLSPIFTSGKLKRMCPLLDEISRELVKTVGDALIDTDVVEMKDVTLRFTMDCISSIAFGYNCNSLREPDNEFRKHGEVTNHFGKLFVLLNFYAADLIDYYSFIPKKRQNVRAFFVDLIEKMVLDRRAKKIARDDFLDMLIQLMDRGVVDEDDGASSEELEVDRITMTEAVAQSVLFFAAAHETTSSVIIWCLYELSRHEDVQMKLQREIDEAFASSEVLTFEKISEMNYLDMVLCETQRKHPGCPLFNRISLADVEIPGTRFRIPKGMRIVIPINGIYSDHGVYPDPDRFDPDRFAPENKAARHPFAYIPFGEGPRHCIAKQLGLFEPKIAMCYLLRNYSFSTCETTPDKTSYSTHSFVQLPSGGVDLRVTRRNT